MRKVYVSNGALHQYSECNAPTFVEISEEEWREYLDHLEQVAEWDAFIARLEQEQNK